MPPRTVPGSVVLNTGSQLAPQGPDEWTPRNVHDDAPDELTLRAALIASNNRAATLLQQQIGSGRVLRVASRSGLADLPDVPSLALGARSGAAIDGVTQHRHHLECHLGRDHALGIHGLFERGAAVGIADARDVARPHREAAVGKHRERRGDRERRDEARAKRQRRHVG